MYCKHDVIQCMYPHIQVSILACIYILVVLILELNIIQMERPFLHKGFPWLLHVLDIYCTVAICPNPLCVALSHTHTHTYTHTHAHTHTHTHTITYKKYYKVQMHSLNTCSLACRVDVHKWSWGGEEGHIVAVKLFNPEPLFT